MLVISSARSNNGKTAVACGLIGTLSKIGVSFEFVKVGPDYIDSMCAGVFTCVNRLNLITSCSQRFLNWLAWAHPCSIVEDNMGVVDFATSGVLVATVHLSIGANRLVLVANCGGGLQTCVFLVQALRFKLSGVVLNSVSSRKHEVAMECAIVWWLGLPVLGAVHKQSQVFRRRHLGIALPFEANGSECFVNKLALGLYYSCNVSKLLQLLLAGVG
ncbi:hypothetical protein AAHH88_00330 [Candidatus Hodgkinia cicadicola]